MSIVRVNLILTRDICYFAVNWLVDSQFNLVSRLILES